MIETRIIIIMSMLAREMFRVTDYNHTYTTLIALIPQYPILGHIQLKYYLTLEKTRKNMAYRHQNIFDTYVRRIKVIKLFIRCPV
jgi:phage anti-repressor protein